MAQHTNWGATGHDAHNILPPVPPTRRGNTVDVLHGTPVTDPYRWLEDEESDETREWTAAQMARTRAVLDGLPDRDRIAARLTTLLETEMVTVPRVRGGRLFYQRRTGEQNQPILYVRNDARSPERVLLDPNTLRGDGTVALDWWYPSPDGTLLAYGLSEGGDEQSTLAVRDVASGDDLPVRIPRTRAASVGWLPDNSGFFYTRYPLPGTVPACEEQYHRHIYFHALGTDPEHDADIFGAGRSPQDWPGIDVSSDGRFLLVIVTQGWAKSEVYLCDLHGEPDAHHPSHFVAVAEGIDANFDGEVVDGVLYLTTNLDAPHYRVFAVDPTEPHRDRWRELIPERAGVALQGVAIVGSAWQWRRW